MDLLRPDRTDKENSMSQSQVLPSVSAATKAFLAGLLAPAPRRVEAKVASEDGVALLCAVEAALAAALARPAAQELVWLSRAPKPGVHVLQLQAFGPEGELLAEAVHEFAA
jgi:hypothetical protein